MKELTVESIAKVRINPFKCKVVSYFTRLHSLLCVLLDEILQTDAFFLIMTLSNLSTFDYLLY